MSLRVLLADESSTIKKVMQLALQDFDVEVKAVPIGLDVLDVCRSFQPEIIFADVLLSKRNGYEVCAELKADQLMHKVPVVLMWSGFMEIDEKKASLAKPDRRLEKPFDAIALRQLVRDLVPRLQGNAISQFLTFPNLPEIEEDKKAKRYAEKKREQSNVPLEPPPEQDVEEFQSVPLPKLPPQPSFEVAGETHEDWARQDLAQFKIAIEEEDLTRDYEKVAARGLEEISLEEMNLDAPVKNRTLPSMTEISHERVEQILREQVREILESIAWKILPDMAERIVREEIQKLMKDAERL